MRIIVEAISAFGVLDADSKKWLNPADKDMLKTFKRGKAYDVEMEEKKGKNGKVFKNIVSATEVSLDSAPVKAVVADVAPVAKKEAPKAEKAFNSSLTAEEKDSRILVQGLTQAFLQSPLLNFIPDGVVPADYVEAEVGKYIKLVKKLSGVK